MGKKWVRVVNCGKIARDDTHKVGKWISGRLFTTIKDRKRYYKDECGDIGKGIRRYDTINKSSNHFSTEILRMFHVEHFDFRERRKPMPLWGGISVLYLRTPEMCM